MAEQPAPAGALRAGSTGALALAALTALGLALRLTHFGDSLFGDELSTYAAASMANGPGDVIDLISDDTAVIELTPPLYFLLAWASAQLGDAVELIRLPALIAGTLAIPAVYAFASLSVGRRAALMAAALTTLSPFLVAYSTEARAYMLTALLVVLSTIALLRAASESPSPWWWAAYALSACASIYSHYSAVFPLAAQAVWALWAHRDLWRPLAVASVAAAIGFLPWIAEYLDEGRSPFNLTSPLHPFGLGSTLGDFADWSLGTTAVEVAASPGWISIALIAAGVMAAVLGLGLRLRRERGLRVSRELVPVVALTLSAPVGLPLYSTLGDDVLASRLLIVSAPALLVALAAVLTAARRPFDLLGCGLVIAGFAIGVVKSLSDEVRPPDYKDAAELVAERTEPDDPIYDPVFYGDSAGPLAVQLPGRTVEHPADLRAAATRSGAEREGVVIADPGDQLDAVGVRPNGPAEPDLPLSYSLVASERFPGSIDVTACVYERVGAGG